MPVLLPVFPSEPLYNERVKIDGRDYIFRFDWSNREQRFYMSIADQDEVSLVAGMKVVANWAMLYRRHFNADLPTGDFYAIDLEQGGEPPTFNDFGTRVRMYYYTAEELAALL